MLLSPSPSDTGHRLQAHPAASRIQNSSQNLSDPRVSSASLDNHPVHSGDDNPSKPITSPCPAIKRTADVPADNRGQAHSAAANKSSKSPEPMPEAVKPDIITPPVDKELLYQWLDSTDEQAQLKAAQVLNCPELDRADLKFAWLKAAWDGNIPVMKKLLEKEQKQEIAVMTPNEKLIFIRNIYGSTALHLAHRKNQVEVVELLYNNEARIDARDGNGNTPEDLNPVPRLLLDKKYLYKMLDIEEFLIPIPVEKALQSPQLNPAHLKDVWLNAACDGKTSVLAKLLRTEVNKGFSALKRGEYLANTRNINGETALNLVCRNRHEEATNYLRKKGVRYGTLI